MPAQEGAALQILLVPLPYFAGKTGSSADFDKAYGFWYALGMGLPKITKPSDLRDDLYNTLDRVAKGNEKHIVPTKTGEVVILSKAEYDSLIDDLDLLKEFEAPLELNDLQDSEKVFARFEKKFGFKNANQMDKKSRKKSR